ncbi:biotin/lipoyl-binding protein [Candidatus Pollutiaquabacter sp.]|uniref:biotin/lipoyl-binding protein n=1 Tax=Candidatus Pollutiaquabacter sp. TaxID=3416354 RepID=UPI003D0B8EF3
MPWTQNIRSSGSVTTYLPQDRPQSLQSVIPGRIERWYIREGQFVHKGDTIVRISEIRKILRPETAGTRERPDQSEGGFTIVYRRQGLRACATDQRLAKEKVLSWKSPEQSEAGGAEDPQRQCRIAGHPRRYGDRPCPGPPRRFVAQAGLDRADRTGTPQPQAAGNHRQTSGGREQVAYFQERTDQREHRTRFARSRILQQDQQSGVGTEQRAVLSL